MCAKNNVTVKLQNIVKLKNARKRKLHRPMELRTQSNIITPSPSESCCRVMRLLGLSSASPRLLVKSSQAIAKCKLVAGACAARRLYEFFLSISYIELFDIDHQLSSLSAYHCCSFG